MIDRNAPTRPALRYHGGKWKLAPWIIGHFPPHRVYVEPFGGAASVLLRKPRSYAEVYNDLTDDMVTFFRVLQDPRSARKLAQLLYCTPFARSEFLAAYERTTDPIECSRRLCVRAYMGFGSASTYDKHVTGFRASSKRSGTTPAHDWANYPDAMLAVAERMRGVVIEHRDAVEVIAKHDGPETLHYVDPPYPHSTRTFKRRAAGQVYAHEMTDDDHRTLALALRGCRGMVVLSGYPCDLYDRDLFPDWQRVSIGTFADGAKPREEILWLNPAAAAARNFSQQLLKLVAA